MTNFSEKTILQILKNKYDIRFLTCDTHGGLEAHTAFPIHNSIHSSDDWSSDDDSHCISLGPTIYENLILDNDLPIRVNDIHFDDVTFNDSPIAIDELL